MVVNKSEQRLLNPNFRSGFLSGLAAPAGLFTHIDYTSRLREVSPHAHDALVGTLLIKINQAFVKEQNHE